MKVRGVFIVMGSSQRNSKRSTNDTIFLPGRTRGKARQTPKRFKPGPVSSSLKKGETGRGHSAQSRLTFEDRGHIRWSPAVFDPDERHSVGACFWRPCAEANVYRHRDQSWIKAGGEKKMRDAHTAGGSF